MFDFEVTPKAVCFCRKRCSSLRNGFGMSIGYGMLWTFVSRISASIRHHVTSSLGSWRKEMAVGQNPKPNRYRVPVEGWKGHHRVLLKVKGLDLQNWVRMGRGFDLRHPMAISIFLGLAFQEIMISRAHKATLAIALHFRKGKKTSSPPNGGLRLGCSKQQKSLTYYQKKHD